MFVCDLLSIHSDNLRINDSFKKTKAMKVREVFKKSKWKFKMAFAMKGGGSRPVSSATYGKILVHAKDPRILGS